MVPALISPGLMLPTEVYNSWLADYFGLPRDFESTVFFNPSISDYILDFSFYAGLDAWIDGLYFRIHGPFVHTKWNLNAEESIATNGSTGYFPGYFSSNVVPATNLNSNFLAYANGCAPLLNNDYAGPSRYLPILLLLSRGNHFVVAKSLMAAMRFLATVLLNLHGPWV